MKRLFLAVLLLALSACAFAQQEYVGRYDFFTGFSYLNSPKLDLQQRGFNTQIGVNLNRWLAFGGDYSIQFGRAALTPSDLKPQYAAPLNQLLAAGIGGAFSAAPPLGYGISLPANYQLWAPFDASTQTFALGPQLVWRPRHKKFDVFGHPSVGFIHENISVMPHDAFTQYIVIPALLGQQIPPAPLPPTIPANPNPTLKSLKPNDTTPFYGVGGGIDYNFSKHLHLRADVEFVHVYLYSDLLATARNSVRLSVGPTFSFGHNVLK